MHAPTTVVLVCGGQVEITAHAPVSFRDAFLRVAFQPPLSKFSFRQAEEADLYRPRPVYSNWKAFEMDVAQLFQLVMLFCESEGSIAELASFSEIDEIAQKLLIVVDNINFSSESYVRLGLIEDIQERYGRSAIFVMQYDGLNVEHGGSLDGIDFVEFARRLGNIIPNAVETRQEPRTFDRGRAGHLIKLMVGFIQHFGALYMSEILVIFYAIDLPQSEGRVRQYIECAKFFDWLVEDEVGQDTLYVAAKPTDAFEYVLRDGSPIIAKSSWRALVRDYWGKFDPDRLAAIARAAVMM
ncbi:retron St85 family effector protein [Phenylobacterium sp.]|uniref:retron St85 family effector protein n=1 Tax=Phenylobacterium sp. TaxID=1871053 RepID=UPI002737B2FA|nr:retron St85 family effector protein [Phenylobacterium sp.]MDP3868777.1 retron St85 family effector protein [Phenylobacterium sp.]